MAEGQRDSHSDDMQKYFDKVITEVSNKWDDLARKLGFSDNQIDVIHGSRTDQDHRCREMLRRWRNKNGKKATLQVLKKALINIDERLTAESLEVLGKKTRQKRERKRKAKQPHEDSSEESSSMGNDLHAGSAPSHPYFPPVAKAVGSLWVKFASEQLSLTAEHIVNIQVQHPSSTERQALQALELWRDRHGRKACRVRLAGALRRGGFQHAADEVDRYGSQEVNTGNNELTTEFKPAYMCIPYHGLHRTEPTHKKRKTQDSSRCSVQFKQELIQSYHVACAESNGTIIRNTMEQTTGSSSNGTQNLIGKTENGNETNLTTTWSSQHHESSSSTSGDESESDKDYCGHQGKHPQKMKVETNASSSGGNTQSTESIYHTILQMANNIFKTSDEFPKTGQDLGNSTTAIVIKTEDDNRTKLSTQVKSEIRKRVNDKIAEVANKILERKLFDKKCRYTLHKMVRCFERFNAALRKAETGCVLCHLDFADICCYDTFWRGYSDGSLSDTLTRELITGDMRTAEGGADLYIHVRVLHSATEEGDFSDQETDTFGVEVKEESELCFTELDRQLATVADHLGSMWERVALSLGFTTHYIRDLTARQPPSLRPRQLICDWMERNAGDITLDQLVQALRNAGIHQVADAAASGQLFEKAVHGQAEKEKPEDDMDATRPDRKSDYINLFRQNVEKGVMCITCN
ncbi:PREDICTED: uncharacterized protein LOC109475980 [Branchiostoma belcheri]|uniref:Uncharacterized protein LOC109475980 n=1 Tax=Branchiostoma belcheri TaxID=7741 RepID=A0A6P4ZRU8_BRABE|nr:PREDICTED: uncharacterized protein LOC109475980 [Branchiostoma belcheri]